MKLDEFTISVAAMSTLAPPILLWGTSAQEEVEPWLLASRVVELQDERVPLPL